MKCRKLQSSVAFLFREASLALLVQHEGPKVLIPLLQTSFTESLQGPKSLRVEKGKCFYYFQHHEVSPSVQCLPVHQFYLINSSSSVQ